MIRINLLPIRAARKREYVKQQLILFAVLVVGASVGLFLWYNAMAGQIQEKKKQIASAEKQIEQYKKAIGEVEKYYGLEETLNRKLKIIDDLIRGKTGPVRVLDRLSHSIPKQVWLTDWKENNGTVILTGEALSNKHVGQFMSILAMPVDEQELGVKNLSADKTKRTKKTYFRNIKLKETVAKEDKKYKLSFVEFTITLNVGYAI